MLSPKKVLGVQKIVFGGSSPKNQPPKNVPIITHTLSILIFKKVFINFDTDQVWSRLIE
jgi:hypothetical protein